MGFLSNIFRKKEQYAALDSAAPSAECLNKFNPQLTELMNKVHDRIEVIPAKDNIYVYIGKPPQMFGMVWYENGREVNFKSLAKDKGLSQMKVLALSGKLGDIYDQSREYERFTASIAGREIIVTPSESFEKDISAVLSELEY